MKSVASATRKPAWRNCATASTPCTPSTFVATSGLKALKEEVVKMKSARRFADRAASNDAFSDADRIETIATRPRPIISAEAVEAVRLGFRIAFWRPELALQSQPPDRGADHRSHRLRDEREEDRDAEERDGRAEPDQGGGVRGHGEQTVEQRGHAESSHDEPEHQPATHPSIARVLGLPERLDGCDPGRPARRHHRGRDRDDGPHEQGDPDRAGLELEPRAGQVDPERLEERLQARRRSRCPRGSRSRTRTGPRRTPPRSPNRAPAVGSHRSRAGAPSPWSAAPR